jgi:NAD-dependent deacetylase
MNELISLFKKANRVSVLTGAGVSAESGIPTFRGAGGYWKNYKAEELATPSAFKKDPALVWEWYAMRMEVCLKAEPNPAHKVINRMEKKVPEFLLITQNVDNLHSRAGNTKLIELHGNIFKAYCTRCNFKKTWETPPEKFPVLCTECNSNMRPDIVWFGETYDPSKLETCVNFILKSDLLFIIGTSGQVSVPVQLAMEGIRKGIPSIEINPEKSTISDYVTHFIQEKAGSFLDQFWKKIDLL